jgi:hypothetical protein
MGPVLGRDLFVLVVILYAVVLSLAIMHNIRRGRPIVVGLLAVLAGPPPGLLVWAVLQKRQPDIGKLTLGNISYAGIVADLLILLPILMLGAIGWRKYGDLLDHWRKPRWAIAAIGVGYLVGMYFHFVQGSGGSPLDMLLHDSATSWLHNFGIVPIFTSTLLVAVVPLFSVAGGRRLAIIATVMFVVGWGGLVAFDMLRMQIDPASYWYFSPHWLDAVMDWSRWTVAS